MENLRITRVLLLALNGVLCLAGCKQEAAKPAPAPPAVTVAVPIEREVRDFDQYTGRIAAVEEVEVRARVKGYLVDIGFKAGDEVTKGQLLFQIDPQPFDAALKAAVAQVDQFKAREVKFDADVKRYKDLVPKGAATAQDLDKAMGELGEAKASIRAAEAEVERAKLDTIYAQVKAPIDGVTSKPNLTMGNLIGASAGGEQLLTTIVRMDPIHVYFDVDQRTLQRIREQALARRAGGPEPKTIRELNIPFQFGLANEEGFPHEGVLDFIDNKVDGATGTITVRGEVKNSQRRFRPGYFARVRVSVADPYKAVLVQDRAIGTQQGQKYVLVVDGKNTVVFRPVQLGALQPDGLRVITSGLTASERIVINGIQRARPGAAVAPEVGQMLLAPATKPAASTRPTSH